MARGGARNNAGRKPLLTDLQRIRVGAECQNRLDAEARAQARQRIDARSDRTTYSEVVEAVHQIPLAERRSWTEDDHADHSFDVDMALRRDQGVLRDPEKSYDEDDEFVPEIVGDDDFGPEPVRYHSEPLRRPQGVNQRIRRDVAREMSAHFGVELKERFVQKCWDEYRAFLKSLPDPDSELREERLRPHSVEADDVLGSPTGLKKG